VTSAFFQGTLPLQNGVAVWARPLKYAVQIAARLVMRSANNKSISSDSP